MTIAYLVNQYPKVSHSFIRREIAGIEACGIRVARFSIRACESELVDEADQAELKRTRVVLSEGMGKLVFGILRTLIAKPVGFLRALALALKLSQGAERGVLYHLAYLAEACVLLGWFAEADVLHVHAHFGTNSTTVAMLCRAMGGPPYSFTVHGPEEFDKVIAIGLPEKIRRAAFVVAISFYGRSQLYRWCSQKEWSKIHVVRCGVDDDFFNQAQTLAPPEARLVCVGRLCEQKGQLLLVDAASQLIAEGLQFKLVLVGDGPLRSEVEKAIAHLGLHNTIEILGWASNAEVRQQILAAQALILPSFAEGLPVVIMESLALGRPVISTYIAGIPELVDPECGWLVPPGSIDDLVEAVRIALAAPVATLNQMGKAGAERVAQQHNSVTEAKKLVILFHAEKSDSGQVHQQFVCPETASGNT